MEDERSFRSEKYWEHRYAAGGNSGRGSYGELAQFKADVVNGFIRRKGITTVIEYGCGDGNQLKLGQYPSYTGFDVSRKAVSMCRKTYQDDKTKRFKLASDYDNETAELTISLDVIYHLTEDPVFEDYMNRLFDSSEEFVIIYSSDTDQNQGDQVIHVRHRNTSKWIAEKKPGWRLIEHIPNRYPYDAATETGSFAEFFIYQKLQGAPDKTGNF